MKRLQIDKHKKSKLLTLVYVGIGEMSNQLRDRICEACGWSIPTFYRKLRTNAILSRAETDKIMEVSSRLYKSALSRITKVFKRMKGTKAHRKRSKHRQIPGKVAAS